MELKSQINLSPDLHEKILEIFSTLTLPQKLVIYAKFMHGSNFRAQNGDLFNLNRRSVSKIYRTFIEKIQDGICSGNK